MTAAARESRDEAPKADGDQGPQLVTSTEPSVVFTSLATQCVPDLCDDCTIEIADGPHPSYRVQYPPRPPSDDGERAAPELTTGRPERLAGRVATTADHVLRVPFTHPAGGAEHRGGESTDTSDALRGEAIFGWHLHTPTRAERTVLSVLVAHAVRTVLWQRSEESASRAAATAANLQTALQSSRNIGTAIGILMGVGRLTQEQAFDLLRATSQRGDRKLRDVALDVIGGAGIDPALMVAGAPRRGRRRGRDGAGADALT